MTITAAGKNRLLSLDIFRGMTIAGMILVNNQGDWSCVYPVLAHASWHGCLGADFVFPFFLFTLGASLYFALTAQLKAGMPRPRVMMSILRRSAVLFLLGILLNLFPSFDFSTVRIPGVLQRIGLCYCFASLLFLYAGPRARAAITLLLLALYGGLLLCVTPHGFGSGSLEPCCNLPGIIDGALFPGHTYEHAAVPGFDPEGLLSTLPAIASTMIGVFTASWTGTGFRARQALPLAGALMAAAGLALSPVMPLNKSLWTPTYVLFTGGAALILFWLCRLLFDGGRADRPAVPFLVLGRNAIAVYLLSSMAGKAMVSIFLPVDGTVLSVKAFLYGSLFEPLAPPCAASCLYAVAFLLVWTGIMYLPYHRRIFISV
jgi:predicted acyltransferase